ncbi:MAG TPA: GNAT family protein [Burkholderiaceae bacterium]|nr:GNAT family protein [Burkholderiaceae bacterium]
MLRPAIDKPELLPLAEGASSSRIVLRRYRCGDGAALFAAIAPHREELMQWMEWPRRHQRVEDSESYARRMHAEFIERKSMPMAIFDAASGAYLGGAGFHAPDWNVPKVEVGYFLVPPARGAGLATEVIRLQIHYAFEQMQVNRVWGSCDGGNDASAGVMRRAGLPEEGLLRAETRDHHGRVRDTRLFGLSLEDYPAWAAQHGLTDLAYLPVPQ